MITGWPLARALEMRHPWIAQLFAELAFRPWILRNTFRNKLATLQFWNRNGPQIFTFLVRIVPWSLCFGKWKSITFPYLFYVSTTDRVIIPWVCVITLHCVLFLHVLFGVLALPLCGSRDTHTARRCCCLNFLILRRLDTTGSPSLWNLLDILWLQRKAVGGDEIFPMVCKTSVLCRHLWWAWTIARETRYIHNSEIRKIKRCTMHNLETWSGSTYGFVSLPGSGVFSGLPTAAFAATSLAFFFANKNWATRWDGERVEFLESTDDAGAGGSPCSWLTRPSSSEESTVTQFMAVIFPGVWSGGAITGAGVSQRSLISFSCWMTRSNLEPAKPVDPDAKDTSDEPGVVVDEDASSSRSSGSPRLARSSLSWAPVQVWKMLVNKIKGICPLWSWFVTETWSTGSRLRFPSTKRFGHDEWSQNWILHHESSSSSELAVFAFVTLHQPLRRAMALTSVSFLCFEVLERFINRRNLETWELEHLRQR